ncbi:GrpB family protein [Amycolatopsis anabasis]|uniref:GrpB family protein n=1 Tax=Amycolatopsis anabasis TaxID=1840409 RepID=UPI001C5543FC|nr:GrpB family protein [Amycolatopsis anabasis]
MGDFELIGGKEKRAIRIVEYDPGWPERFRRERERIAGALGDRALRIDHVGSTSVPGLVAKPIIDIDVSVADVEDERGYLDALLGAGYVLRVREPGHRMVRTVARDVHVHVCAAGSEWERRHLLFRDWLREHPKDREAYGRLKQELSARDWADMNEYAEAKGPFIAEVTARAERAGGVRPVTTGLDAGANGQRA